METSRKVNKLTNGDDNVICLSCTPDSWSARIISSGYRFVSVLGCICGIEITRSSSGAFYFRLEFDSVNILRYYKRLRLTIWAHDEEGKTLFCYDRVRSLSKSRCLLGHESDQLLQRAMAIFCRIETLNGEKALKISDSNATQPDICVINGMRRLHVYENAFDSGFMADCEIHARNRVFKVSKFMIGLHSDVLRVAFQHSTIEQKLSRYTVDKSMDPAIIEQMLRYCYTGQVNDLEKIDIDLLIVADYFSMSSLMELCADSIRKSITMQKLPKLCELFAWRSGLKELETFSIQFLQRSTEPITRHSRRSRRHKRMFEAFDSGLNYPIW